MKPFSKIAGYIAVIMAMALVSCTSDEKNDLLKYIPADSEFVLVADINAVIENAGCTAENGKIILSPELQSLVDLTAESVTKAQLEIFLGSGVDFSSVALYKPSLASGACVAICKLADADEFKNLIVKGEMADNGEFEGLKWYRKDGVSFLVGDDIAFTFDDNTFNCSQVVNISADSSIKSVGWKADLLSKNNAINTITLYPGSLSGLLHFDFSNIVYNVGVNFEGPSLKYNFAVYNEDGSECPYKHLVGEIDTDVLEYMIPTDVIALAFAVNPDADWAEYNKEVSKMLGDGSRTKLVLAALLPYQKMLGGTFIVAGGPTAGVESLRNPTLGNWSFFAMLQVKSDDYIEMLMTQIESLSAMSGFPVTEIEDGLALEIPGEGTLRVQKIGNYIALANRELKKTDNGVLPEEWFANTFCAICAKLDKSDAIALWGNLPFGIDVSSHNAELTVTLTGTDKDFIEAIISYALTKAGEKAKRESDMLLGIDASTQISDTAQVAE